MTEKRQSGVPVTKMGGKYFTLYFSHSDGRLLEVSNKPVEGFEKRTRDDGKVVYERRLYEIRGYLDSIYEQSGSDTSRDSLCIKLLCKSEETYTIKLNMYSSSGYIDQVAEKVIRTTPALTSGEEVIIRGYKIESEFTTDEGELVTYDVKGLSFSRAGNGDVHEKIEMPIPASELPKKNYIKTRGKNIADTSSIVGRNEFLFKVLEKHSFMSDSTKRYVSKGEDKGGISNDPKVTDEYKGQEIKKAGKAEPTGVQISDLPDDYEMSPLAFLDDFEEIDNIVEN